MILMHKFSSDRKYICSPAQLQRSLHSLILNTYKKDIAQVRRAILYAATRSLCYASANTLKAALSVVPLPNRSGG